MAMAMDVRFVSTVGTGSSAGAVAAQAVGRAAEKLAGPA